MFVVIEGLDGAGKSTQVARLQEWIEAQGKSWEYLHFPRFTTPYWGDLVARFLRGELGAIDAVDPRLVAMIYAGDRADAAATIRGWLDAGKVVIADRYVLSNVAYQCAKSSDSTLKEWILGLEYDYNQIPRPDVELFLDVPFRFTQAKLTEVRQGDDRGYLDGKQDIHEASLTFQQRVREQYLAHKADNYSVIECADAQTGAMLGIETIAKKISDALEGHL